MADDLLPKLKPVPGMKHLANMRDLLTPEEHKKLDADLAEMARLRRRAEAEASNVYLA